MTAAVDPGECRHGYRTYTDAAGRVHISTGGRCVDVPVAPDPERDKRVAARRAADAARAGAALDRLIDAGGSARSAALVAYRYGWREGYAASEEHHNGHYDVSLPTGGEMPAETVWCDCLGATPTRRHPLGVEGCGSA